MHPAPSDQFCTLYANEVTDTLSRPPGERSVPVATPRTSQQFEGRRDLARPERARRACQQVPFDYSGVRGAVETGLISPGAFQAARPLKVGRIKDSSREELSRQMSKCVGKWVRAEWVGTTKCKCLEMAHITRNNNRQQYGIIYRYIYIYSNR